jgi:hypothetical protein
VETEDEEKEREEDKTLSQNLYFHYDMGVK